MNQHYCTGKEFLRIQRELSRKQDVPCPFCHKRECEHWDGTGWVNPRNDMTPARRVVPVHD